MILVTGGAGFIGSNILAALDARGETRLAVCDRLRNGEKWRNVAKRELADIVHPDRLDEFLEREGVFLEAVVHMGAISATTETDADLIAETNFRLSRRLWEWCSAHHVRFVYASSAATYGDGANGFADDPSIEGLAKLLPLNAYGWSKLLFDRWVVRQLATGAPCPPQWVGLRFFNVYGPNEYHKGGQKSVVAHLFPRARAGEPARLFKSHNPRYADGGQLRDFIWVGDCVSVVTWLLDHPEVSGIYNCGTGQARSFEDLARAVYGALDAPFEVEFVPTPENIRAKYQYFTEADMTRLRAAGFDASFTSLEDGVSRYVRDYLNAEDPFR